MTKPPEAEVTAGDEQHDDEVGKAGPARSLEMPKPTSTRYPDYDMPFVGSQEEQDGRFAESVEAFLVNYGYNTARAYRADLEDIYLWAAERGLDFFELTEAQMRQYQALLRRRKYSEGTVRRRGTAWRSFSQTIGL
jgi:hypothetical protein